MQRAQSIEKLRPVENCCAYIDTDLESRGIRKTKIKGEEVFRFGNVLMLGDGIIYQLLRSAFKQYPQEIVSIAMSP
ncbi:hypothetical protein U1Q18_044655, partial [Sarracenia purpurea var. burkii]